MTSTADHGKARRQPRRLGITSAWAAILGGSLLVAFSRPIARWIAPRDAPLTPGFFNADNRYLAIASALSTLGTMAFVAGLVERIALALAGRGTAATAHEEESLADAATLLRPGHPH